MTDLPATADDLPPVRVEPNARRRIRQALVEAGRRIAVLDDDPTGSQTVHDVAVVTVFEPEEIAAGLDAPGSTCFILTNTRSLPEAEAVELNTRVGRMLFELGARLDAPVDVVSRSDSTLRGHVIAEVRALDAARREVTGRGYDGVLLVPGVHGGRAVHRGRHALGATSAMSCCRSAKQSSPATPRSASPRPTCASSSRRRAAATSTRRRFSASRSMTSATGVRSGSRRSSPA